ncbi:MAG: hypothetical protein PHS69_10160, partial [Firmicutes bacterium]|nr:hypothetical protein [Bacillota bacterium]
IYGNNNGKAAGGRGRKSSITHKKTAFMNKTMEAVFCLIDSGCQVFTLTGKTIHYSLKGKRVYCRNIKAREG